MSAKGKKKSSKVDFTEDDLTDMAFQSNFHMEIANSKSLIDPKFLDLQKDFSFKETVEQLDAHNNKASNIGHLTRFLTLLNENSAAARILSKEYQC